MKVKCKPNNGSHGFTIFVRSYLKLYQFIFIQIKKAINELKRSDKMQGE